MKKLWALILLFLLMLAAMPLAGNWFRKEKAYTPDNLIRIHVVANSDRVSDQALKIKVKDRVVEMLRPRLARCRTAGESRLLITRNLAEVEAAVQEELKAGGMNYKARAFMGVFPFPDRKYGTLFLPRGDYQALRIVLGEGRGHNWWCVMYPPLCMLESKKDVKPTSGLYLKKMTKAQAKRKAASK